MILTGQEKPGEMKLILTTPYCGKHVFDFLKEYRMLRLLRRSAAVPYFQSLLHGEW